MLTCSMQGHYATSGHAGGPWSMRAILKFITNNMHAYAPALGATATRVHMRRG